MFVMKRLCRIGSRVYENLFDEDKNCEDVIKDLSKKDPDLELNASSMRAKSLCIPFSQSAQVGDKDKCIKPGCTVRLLFYAVLGCSYRVQSCEG